jgi:hypothetical protein
VRAPEESGLEVTMGSLAIAILLLAPPATSAEPAPLFETTFACAVEAEAFVTVFESTTASDAAATSEARAVLVAADEDPEPRSLALAAESLVRDGDPSLFAVRVERPTAPSPLKRIRLESPGRAWPFALAATADAATTYWALSRGGVERNPLLAVGRMDVGMVKFLQFPLIAKALDVIEGRNPRLGRRLRWTTLVFHAVLAFNNVRLGRAAGEPGLGARRTVRP